ncbi:MAG: SO_0444 family Cu/Zn efflux transporter [Alteromonadales bacterium]|nr:SO_0444 family Cu/Zn efflux transporter [Alteromonadales bacterium]
MLLINFIDLFLDSAPWLLLGLVLAGMLKMFVPMSWMQKQLGGHGIKTTVKAALLGAPLPLCSCGVIPAAVGLRRSGASKAATTSFLVSTPETGVDSVAISYVLLGPFMAIVRPIAAIISAIVAGLLVGRDDQPMKAKPAATLKIKSIKKVEATSCCSSQTSSCSTSEKVATQAASSDCCESTRDIASELKGTSVFNRIIKGIHYAATDLVKDTALWLLIGIFFAALVQTYVPADFMAKWGDGLLAMLVVVVISIPMYICATASTPIAAGLLLAGVSPGAVLVFMLAGPATNIATLGVVAKELGKRALWGYLGGVLGVALISGMLVNYLVSTFGFVVMPQVDELEHLLPHAVTYSLGFVLALLMIKALFDMIPRKNSKQDCCS